MGNLIGMIGRWIARNVLRLLLIVTVLVLAGYIQKEINAYLAMRDIVAVLESGRQDIKSVATTRGTELDERIKNYKTLGHAALNSRVSELVQQIKQKSADRGSLPDPKTCILMGGDACKKYLDGIKIDVELDLLTHERDYLLSLRSAGELGRLRGVHAAIYAQYQNNELAIAMLKASSPTTWWVPFTDTNDRYEYMVQRHKDLYAQNMRAYEAYMVQKRLLEALKKGQVAVRSWQDRIDTLLKPLDQQISAVQKEYQENWVAILFEKVNKVVPAAFGILVGIILTPLGIKGFFYFVIAPMASRRAAMRLLPETSGEIIEVRGKATGSSDRLKVSEVSHSITIQKTQELLIHPEYLQTATTEGKKDTKWLLDWSYPLTSMAAGLFGLTRIQTASSETIVVSATRDPLSEVGTISLPEGSALVIQPHRLIGVVHLKNSPIKISRHWRLGSLHAWLTLQLRFLAFHGPVQLVVKGCRGIRIEAAGKGRSINQAATIGFSANLAYSTTRCETFGSYLMGKQELFNDKFSGEPGFYVYEEMPHGGNKTGLFGRGIEGLTDSILKVFGV